MGKSVYSVVLSDDVVELVDALAYKQQRSRSAMIDHILAQAVSMVTPEQRVRSVLGVAQELLEENEALQILPSLSSGALSMKSPLRFKYNPTIKYSVVLSASSEGTSGELRVWARTQSEQLVLLLTDFFRCFARVTSLPPSSYAIGGGRFVRSFASPPGDSSEAGRAISQYVSFLCQAMGAYAGRYPDKRQGEAAVARLSFEYQNSSDYIL